MLRKILLTFAFLLLLTPLLFQVTRANADQNPITSPVTTPITSPVSVFNLTGHVTYEHLGWLFGNMHRFMDGANVLVTVEDFFHHNKKFTTTTDANGNYSFDLQPGLYQVTVKDSKHTFFVPPIDVVTIKANKTAHANFNGLLFPKF